MRGGGREVTSYMFRVEFSDCSVELYSYHVKPFNITEREGRWGVGGWKVSILTICSSLTSHTMAQYGTMYFYIQYMCI